MFWRRKNIPLITYLSVIFIMILFIIVFSILGRIERKGYFSDFVLESYHSTAKEELEDNYIYSFRLKYYENVFRNNDIYDVYVLTNNLPNFVKKIKFDKYGSPFGRAVSDKILSDNFKVDNVVYELKIKPILYVYLLFFILAFPLFIFNKKIWKIIRRLNIRNIRLFLFDGRFKYCRKFILKVYFYFLVFVTLFIGVFYFLGSKEHIGNLDNFEIIEESVAGYVYRADIISKDFFKPNIIYTISKMDFINKPDYIVNSGYLIEFNSPPSHYDTNNALILKIDDGFIASNSTGPNYYSYIVPIKRGDKYKINVEARKIAPTIEYPLKEDKKYIEWYLDDANGYKKITNTDNMSFEYSIYSDIRKIEKITTKDYPNLHFYFPKDTVAIKSIRIEQIDGNKYSDELGGIIFTSSFKLTDFDDILVLYTLKVKLSILVYIIIAAFLPFLLIFIVNVPRSFIVSNVPIKLLCSKIPFSERFYDKNEPVIYDILLAIFSLWAFVSTWSVIFFKIFRLTDYTSYRYYTLYPAVFIIIFVFLYLTFIYKKKDSIRLFIRYEFIAMLIYFFSFSVRIDLVYFIAILHIIISVIIAVLYFKIGYEYSIKLYLNNIFKDTFKYSCCIRHQIFIMLFFTIFYFLTNVGFYLSAVYYAISAFVFLFRDLSLIQNRKIYIKMASIFTLAVILFVKGENGKIYNDDWSDANVHAAGINFVKDGFLKYKFLPNYALPNEDPMIYTHYPPFPELMFGVMYKFLGAPKYEIKEYSSDGRNLDNWILYTRPLLWKYAFWPYLWYLTGSLFLWAFFTKICRDKFFAMLATLLIITGPSILYFKFGFHYLSYSSSVLMATPYFIYMYMKYRKKRYAVVLVLFGFLQGALSFDYIPVGVGISFLTLFFPVNKKFYFNKKMFFPAIFMLSGVSIAFLLHFIQNGIYFNSFSKAFEDLFGSFIIRSSSTKYLNLGWRKTEDMYFYSLLREYSGYLNTNRYFGFPLAFFSVFLSFIFACLGYLNINIYKNNLCFKSAYFKSIFIFLICAIAISSAWVLIMKQHSVIHIIFLPRHYILLFMAFITVLISLSNHIIKKNMQFLYNGYNNDEKN